MESPHKKFADELYRLLLEDKIPNHIYEGTTRVPTETPDYDKVFKLVQSQIKSAKDILGSSNGIPTTTLLKLAIQGGFEKNLLNPGNSAENYRMIGHLVKTTLEENPKFWEETQPDPSPEEASKALGFLLAMTAKPAAAIAATRMEMENFSINPQQNPAESLREATKVAKLLQDSPAFQTELKGLRKFCTLQSIYEEDIPSRTENLQRVKSTATAIAREDFASLSSWQSGRIGLELESATKLCLFSGKSGQPILDTEVEKARKNLGKTQELSPEDPS